MGLLKNAGDYFKNLQSQFFVTDDDEDEYIVNTPAAEPKPAVTGPTLVRSQPTPAPASANVTPTPSRSAVNRYMTAAQKPVVEQPQTPQPEARPQATATSTGTNRGTTMNNTETMGAAAAKIAIKYPESYNPDILNVAKLVANGESVLVNFQNMDNYQATRSVDFFTGVVYAIDGDIKKVDGEVFLLTPPSFSVDSEQSLSVKNTLDQSGYNF
jgi:cell division inhibitor SepF